MGGVEKHASAHARYMQAQAACCNLTGPTGWLPLILSDLNQLGQPFDISQLSICVERAVLETGLELRFVEASCKRREIEGPRFFSTEASASLHSHVGL